MALTPGQARTAWNEARHTLESLGSKFTKPDLQAAAEAMDVWVDANSASFNSALPTAFRTGSTAQEKAALFTYVLMARYRG